VLIAIGINDSRHGKDTGKPIVGIEKFKENLEKIYAACKSKKVIFVGISCVDEKKANPWKDKGSYHNDTIKEYDSAIEAMAKSHNLQFIPVFDVLEDSDLYDGLHPNASGHRKIFERVISCLPNY